MKRKNLFIAASLLMTAAMTACGGGAKKEEIPELTGTFNFQVWCADLAAPLMTAQLEAYKDSIKEDFPDVTLNFEIRKVGEGDAATQVLNDVQEAPDIYCFAQDQLARLVTAGALNKITGNMKTEIVKRNDTASVAAASHKGNLYAFPLTSDNGYYMYYDKSVVKEASKGDLDKIIADVRAANKSIYFNGSSAWYNAAFFFGAGCTSEWEQDPETEAWKIVKDNYNSDKGVVAAKGLSQLVTLDTMYVDGSGAGTAFGSDGAVCISGTWDYKAAQEKLGENLGCAELPSFNVNGKAYHLGSFSGSKLVGVKKQSGEQAVQRAYLTKQIASFITNEENQLQRFAELGWGPSNLNAQKNKAVQQDEALVALNAQNNYATVQGQYPGSWWDAAGAIGKDLVTAGANPTDAAIKEILKAYQEAIKAIK